MNVKVLYYAQIQLTVLDKIHVHCHDGPSRQGQCLDKLPYSLLCRITRVPHAGVNTRLYLSGHI